MFANDAELTVDGTLVFVEGGDGTGEWCRTALTVGRLKQIIREVINESYAEQAEYYSEPGRELGEQPVHGEGA